jgi:hypothetical protein
MFLCKDVRHIVIPDISLAVEHADGEDLRSYDICTLSQRREQCLPRLNVRCKRPAIISLLGTRRKASKDAMIKLANGSREGSILIERATKGLPLTGTSNRSVRRPSYFYVMRRSGTEPEPKCRPKVHEARLPADESVRNLHAKCHGRVG